MLSSKRLVPIAALAAAMLGVPAGAVTTYAVSLNSLNQVPPAETQGTGSGTLTLSNDQDFLKVAITFANLSAPAIAGHLHCCAPATANGPVAVPFMPTLATSGSITGTYDLLSAGTYDVAFLNAAGSVAAARTTVLDGLNGGLAYVNIHTSTFPGGEIRGQVGPGIAGAVPEPASWALLIGGFALTGQAMRRRRAVVA